MLRMQIVFLSARPEMLSETIDHVRHFAPFFDEIVAVVPERLMPQFDSTLTLVSDEEVTGLTSAEISSISHASRNYLLRTEMLSHAAINDVFVMSDDDSRPLVPIDGSTFINPDGSHRRRWFYAMSAWHRDATDFDTSMQHTQIILSQLGVHHPLSYSSHMPQVIDRAIFAETAELLLAYRDRYVIQEWSAYFNLGAHLYPDRFADPEPFATLGWPQYPLEWPHQVVPARYLFENHHGELHQENGLYAGIPTGCVPDTIDQSNIEKIVRYKELETRVRRLDFPDDVDQPWTTPSRARKAAFTALKRVRQASQYVSIDENARLAELEGRIEQIERSKGSM